MTELQMIVEKIFNDFWNDEITIDEAKEMLDSLGVTEIFKVAA